MRSSNSPRRRVLADPDYHRAQLMWTIVVGVVVALSALYQATRGAPRHALMEDNTSLTDAGSPLNRLRSTASIPD